MSNQKPNCNYNVLCETIKEKDKVTARNLILNNASVNIPTAKGNTPLHWAVLKFRDLDIMTMLLDKGANIHAKNRLNQKPLDVAIRNNKTKVAKLLIRRGAVGEDLNSLLLMAIEKNNKTIVMTLIDHEIENNSFNDLKILLNIAISQGQLKIIEHIRPHFRFLTSSDKYIPKEVVIKSDSKYKECIELLKKNFTVDPNSKDDEDFVYAAVKNGYLPIVLQLLKFGIDVDMVNPKTGLNLLKVACLNEHHTIVKYLLKHNACLNVKTPTDTKILNNLVYKNCNHLILLTDDNNDLRNITCLHIAVLNADPKMTELLLEYGATIIDDPTFFNITCIAIQNNCEEIVRIFLERGVNVNGINSKGKSLLHYCTLPIYDDRVSMYKITKLLLDQGATTHIQTPSNKLMFKAVQNKLYRISQLFLDYNADVQYISPDGDTVLHVAIENYFDVNFIETLLKLNISVNTANNSMLTPLLVACKIQSIVKLNVIKLLLDYNANVNCTDTNSMTPLHFAYRADSVEFITILLQKGANLSATNIKGRTPLHLVCKYNTNTVHSLIQLLLKHNADIEAVDKKGWTPLFVACKAGNKFALKYLLENHANINHTDFNNLTPLYIAVQNCKCNSEIIRILLRHKVNVHCMDNRGNSVIHVAVDQDNPDIIEILTSTQINFNSINKDGDTPLHIAVQKESVRMVYKLIRFGANVNIVDKNNRTPLKAAVEYMTVCRNKYEDYRDRYSWWSSSENDSDSNSWDTDIYENHIYPYKEIMKILKMQVIKLKIAELKVNNQNFKITYTSDENEISYAGSSSSSVTSNSFEYEEVKIDIVQFELECEQEIEKMKMKSIGLNNITFHDLLTRSIHFLSRFVKNKKIRQLMESNVYDNQFPLYMDIVRNRYRDAKFRYRMMNSAIRYFSLHVCHRLSDDCIYAIFSYLNIKDLKMFIRAMKPLDV